MKKNTLEKYKGLTFAQAAEKISKKYSNKETDATEKAAYEAELELLNAHQTNVRMATQMEASLKEFRNGGTLPKYGNGTNNLFPDVNGTPQFANNLYGQISYPNTWADPNPNDIDKLPTLPFKNPFEPVGPPAPFRGQTTTALHAGTSNPLVIDNNSGMSRPSDAPKLGGQGSAYTPALIGQGVSAALSASMLLGGYDKVAPVDNPYESQVKNLMASRGIDTTQQRNEILGAYNAAKEGIKNARSANVQQALGTNLMTATQNSLAESKLQEQQINQGYRADYAQTLGSLGQQKVQAQNYAEQLNNQSKSNWQAGVSELGKHLADIGLSQTTLKLNNVQQTAIANIMSQKYPDFVIGDAALKSYLNGTYTDEEFVKLKQATTKYPELQSIVDFATFQKQSKK